MLRKIVLIAALVAPYGLLNAAPVVSNAANNTTATISAPPLRQGQNNNAANNTASASNAVTALQQKHKLELAEQQKRLALLEQANQTALAQNQELQLKNDNLNVQVQVLQSERSAQMFIYGAVTFASGTLLGLIIYSVIYTRRRRF